MSKKCVYCNANMADNMNFCPECKAKWASPTYNATNNECSNDKKIEKELTFWQKLCQPRIGLLDYWIITVPVIMFMWGSVFIASLVPLVGLIIYLITFIPIVICLLVLDAKRFRDSGKSAWCLLLALVPAIGHIILIVFLCLSGDKEENKYGKVPQRIFFNK